MKDPFVNYYIEIVCRGIKNSHVFYLKNLNTVIDSESIKSAKEFYSRVMLFDTREKAIKWIEYNTEYLKKLYKNIDNYCISFHIIKIRLNIGSDINNRTPILILDYDNDEDLKALESGIDKIINLIDSYSFED